MEDGQPIEHRMVSNAIERAQKRVEAHNFDIRKHLLEYDNVMNKQREVIYGQRREILGGANLSEEILQMIQELTDDLLDQFTDERTMPEDWDLAGLEEAFRQRFGLRLELNGLDMENLTLDDLRDAVHQQVQAAYGAQRQAIGPENFLRCNNKLCCRWWTPNGKTICWPWIICGMASACGVMPRLIPSGPIKKKATTCS